MALAVLPEALQGYQEKETRKMTMRVRLHLRCQGSPCSHSSGSGAAAALSLETVAARIVAMTRDQAVLQLAVDPPPLEDSRLAAASRSRLRPPIALRYRRLGTQKCFADIDALERLYLGCPLPI